MPQKPAIYRPKHIQLATANRTGPVININDQEMFPTFEAAEKMEKLRKDDDKKKFVQFFLNKQRTICLWFIPH